MGTSLVHLADIRSDSYLVELNMEKYNNESWMYCGSNRMSFKDTPEVDLVGASNTAFMFVVVLKLLYRACISR